MVYRMPLYSIGVSLHAKVPDTWYVKLSGFPYLYQTAHSERHGINHLRPATSLEMRDLRDKVHAGYYFPPLDVMLCLT
jgi:hypothetical protein